MAHIPADSFGFFTEDFGPKVVNPAGDAILEAISWTNSDPAGARLADGTIAAFAAGISGTSGILIQSPHLAPIATLNNEEDVFTVELHNLGMSIDHFYSLANITGSSPTPPPFTWRFKKITALGAVVINIVGNAHLPGNTDFAFIAGLAGSPDNTILYWAGGEDAQFFPGSETVRRFDLVGLVGLSDLVTLAGRTAGEMMCLPSGDILVIWALRISPWTVVIRRYTPAGALQLEYTFAVDYSPRGLALNKEQDSLSFWAYVNDAEMHHIRTADGVVLAVVPITT